MHNIYYDRAGLPPYFGSPGWVKGDKEILIYDQYDVWAISPNGKSKRRLINGREQGITYRLYDKLFEQYPSFSVTGKEYDLSNELVFRLENRQTKKTGYAIWDSNTIKRLVYRDFYVDYLKKGANTYIYRKQKFDLSPQLIIAGESKKRIKF